MNEWVNVAAAAECTFFQTIYIFTKHPKNDPFLPFNKKNKKKYELD